MNLRGFNAVKGISKNKLMQIALQVPTTLVTSYYKYRYSDSFCFTFHYAAYIRLSMDALLQLATYRSFVL